MKEYQLIVIGAGPGGYVAALRAAKLGMTVAVVENREAGGTCLNRGCIPTKTLLHSSEAYHAATASAGIGIHVEGARADMNEIFAYKRQISAKLSSGIESLFKGLPLLNLSKSMFWLILSADETFSAVMCVTFSPRIIASTV